MNSPGFELDVKFMGNSDGSILTPLRILDFGDVKAGKTNNVDVVAFEIGIQHNNVDKLTVVVTGSTGVIYQEILAQSMRVVGKHTWQWDGFGTNGILDTKILKDAALTVEFNAQLGSMTTKKVVKLKNRHAEVDWIDVAIDKTKNEIDVALRINVKDGGARGVGESPPTEVKNDPTYKLFRPNDVRTQKHVRIRSVHQLIQLTVGGLRRYWSRRISTKSGTAYMVNMNPVAAKKKAMDDINVVYNTNRDWLRSSNPGEVRGLLSIVGNVFVAERIAYNIGWIKFKNGWIYVPPFAVDRRFEETAAHEMGHEILGAYGGEQYSYMHRGSSDRLQNPLPLKSGGVSYPASGEIDLMKYYHGTVPAGFFSRVFASEQDVKSLIWLARVRFNA